MLQRTLEKSLEHWRIDDHRKPLIIRGARQVGKSHLIDTFGKKAFTNFITINFELEPKYKECFSSLHPKDICCSIEVLTHQKIVPGKTLLFLDEIQNCAEAITALRYFKEKMPNLHVIGAGSLLEFTLNQSDFRMPVGRIAFLYLYPVSFKEFLLAFNPQALHLVCQADLTHPLPEAVHHYLLDQVKLYLLLGGMPEVIATYQHQQDLSQAQRIQTSILETYQHDFGHYETKNISLTHLQRCFRQAPLMIGQQIKYNKIDPELRARELKEAISALELANILQRVNATSATGLPLDATINEKKFKLNFIDVGLVKRANQLEADLLFNNDILLLNRGALAEQFVGQEMLACSSGHEKIKLYFWARDTQGAAEIDYVTTVDSHIFPIEVKAGKIGKLRSMHQYLLEHPKCPMGVRISSAPLSLEKNILSVPFYMISELKRLLEKV